MTRAAECGAMIGRDPCRLMIGHPRSHQTYLGPSRYAHLMADFDLRPLQIAAHLRDAHGIEPKAARKRYEREVWHAQHEYDGHPKEADR